MTFSDAKKLYIEAGGQNDYGESEWQDIHKEMQALVDAKSDRAAGKTIMWWDCWDNKYTATGFARRVRQIQATSGMSEMDGNVL